MAMTYKQPGRSTKAATKAGRDYDRELLNDENYQRVQQAKEDWQNATTQEARDRANQQAEAIRAQSGYSLGRDGATYSPVNARPGTSSQSNYGMQAAQNQAYNSQFDSAWESQLSQMVDQILSRPRFTYDLNADALYNQYRDQYTRLGRQAMEDTMGQAAGLTGGYGSTYAQNAGQQAYYSYLDKLNDVVPELYSQARAGYDAEGQQLYNNASLIQTMYGKDYDRWRDQVGDAQSQLSYWQNQQNAESGDYWNQQSYDQQQAETAYSHQQDQWNRLYNMATSGSNYKPTDQELAAGGMSRDEYNGYVYAWQLQQYGGGSSGGSGGGGGSGRSGGGSSSGSSGSGKGSDLSDIAASIYSQYSGAALDSRTVDNAIAQYGLSSSDRQAIKQYLQALGMQYSRR